MKAVVFDFGGVMTTSTMPERVREVARELGIGWEVIERGFAKYRHAYDAGDITMKEMYARIWADAWITVSPEDTERVIKADRASWLFRNVRTLEWMACWQVTRPADLVFIDDVEENCAGARAAGWSAIRFQSNEQVERDFAALA